MAARPRVFISYTHADREYAEDIYKVLALSGASPWMDIFELLPGQDWRLEVEKAIEAADYFIAILSSKSVSKRGYVQKELKLALGVLDEFPEAQVYIIPIRLDGCPIPRSLRAKHCLDWGAREGLDRLLRVIGLEAGQNLDGVEMRRRGPLGDEEWHERREQADNLLAQQGIQVIVGRLGEREKVELLYLFRVNREGWCPPGYYLHKKLLETELIYVNGQGKGKKHILNNYEEAKTFALTYLYGLGDEHHLVRGKFLDALASLPQNERDALFDGIVLLDARDEHSPK